MPLHELIEEKKDELVRAWMEAVRARLPQEKRYSDDQIRDSMHLFLPEVVLAVRGSRERSGAQSFIAQAHGGQRHVLGANIGAVVTEYSVLYDVIADVASGSATQEELGNLARFLFSAAADAARIFAAEHDAALRKHAWEHFAFMAHEIRNPLQSARLAAELLRTQASKPAVDALGRSLEALAGAVDHALLEARLTGLTAGGQLHLERLDLLRLAKDLAQEVEGDARARSLTLTTEGPALEVMADQRLIRSALANLVRNAIKFSRAGGSVRIVTRRAEQLAQIAVHDECGGLPPQKAEALFAAFVQSGKDRSGFGLGLAIARQAIEAHKGTVRVDDVPGHGCVFVIELPT